MKRLSHSLSALLLLLALLLLPLAAQAETILWEDENGQVIRGDDGSIGFAPASSAPAELSPTPTPTPRPAPASALQYGDSGEEVLAAQELLTQLGYYHGTCSGRFLEGTQSAVRRFQQLNGLPQTGKLEPATWVVLFSEAAIARDGSAPFATPSPVPEATPFAFSRTLQYGDSGEDVAALQARLAELGFYEAKVSGGFYKVTRSAIKAFQTHNGLSADGVAGRETQERLFSDAAVPASAQPLPSPTPQPAKYTLMVDVANQITRAYTYDEQGEYTVLVREMICSTGTKSNPTPLGTTIMPSKRARWGYFPTWDSHAQYLTRIDSANAFHSVLYTAPDESTLSVKSFEALGTPASHGCVRLLVSDAKWIYDNCPAGTIITVYEGEYDPEYTMTLKPTLNERTLRENPLPEPTPTPTYARESFPASYRTLSRGKTGEDVFMVQCRLAELGYYTGTITGGYYGGTIAAVEAFQRDHGLSVDGAAGQQTQALLFSEALDPTPTPPPEATPAPIQAEPSPEDIPPAQEAPGQPLSPPVTQNVG